MSPRRTHSLWSDKADEILSDGEWHNGPDLVWDLMKMVPAGLALRELEADRVITRIGSEAIEELARENPDEPRTLLLHRLREELPRRSQWSDDALIQSGRQRLVRMAVRERVRSGRWEIRGLEWPPSREQWRKGDWELRDAYTQSRTLSQLASDYGMELDTLRKVITDYGIPVIKKGRITRIHLDRIVELDRAVEKVRSEQRIARTRLLLEMRRRHLQEELDRRRQP